VKTADGLMRSAGALRMVRHRKRQREGLKCVTVLVRAAETDTLIRRGWLTSENRDDVAAVRDALHQFMDRHLL